MAEHDTRRAVVCGCGWTGSRIARANCDPCPDCGGTVCVSANPQGRPTQRNIRLQLYIPALWLPSLGDDRNTTVRNLIRVHFESVGGDVDADGC